MLDLTSLLAQAESEIKRVHDRPALQQIESYYLGKKGKLVELFKSLNNVPEADRPFWGQSLNRAKSKIEAYIQQRKNDLIQEDLDKKLLEEKIDITLPGRGQNAGSLHPLTQVLNRVEHIFYGLGFENVVGQEIENEYYNFEALNIPIHHPARESFDTFYFKDGSLLRTHTSTVQIRHMEKQKPPIRMITMGRVYRRDSDATHSPMFNQLEGLLIEPGVSFAHLKGILHEFLKAFFGRPIEMRLRPSYFPFTEPSAEVDIRWGNGKWLEILGCGMVHPQVLKNVKIKPSQYTGFAFGCGLDRLAMLFYGIDDLRLFFENDIRFLKQF